MDHFQSRFMKNNGFSPIKDIYLSGAIRMKLVPVTEAYNAPSMRSGKGLSRNSLHELQLDLFDRKALKKSNEINF